MIKNINIQNFKSIKEASIELSYLNLFTGVNASGKSTFLQSLLLLRQSYQGGYLRQRNKMLFLGMRENAPLINLGTYKDVRYEYAENSEGLVIGFNDNEDKMLKFHSKPYDSDNKGLPTIAGSLETNFTDLDDITLFSPAFQYLSADRISPQEDYPRFGSNDEILDDDGKLISAFLGKDGAFSAHFLEKHGDKVITIKSLQHERTEGNNDSLLGQVNYWMQDISPNIDIQAIENRKTNRIELSYRYKTDNGIFTQDRKPQNVGYGITPTLPILVAILAAKPGDIIIIENPETHVHPKGQTRLALLISKAAEAGVQFLIESHSDHILNGIRVATKHFHDADEKDSIGKGINCKKVKIFFFERQTTQQMTQIIPIKIDKKGSLSQWPQSFFDEWRNILDELMD
jgi:predicted ATPase